MTPSQSILNTSYAIGGLMVKDNGKWTIRGIVSAAVRGADGSCDLENYVIFTDVARNIDWIKRNM